MWEFGDHRGVDYLNMVSSVVTFDFGVIFSECMCPIAFVVGNGQKGVLIQMSFFSGDVFLFV